MPKEPRQRSWAVGKIIAMFGGGNSKNNNNNSDENNNQQKSSAANNKPRRDFCFNTANGPVFFCTRDDFCENFGYRHGDFVQYGTQHPLNGWRCTIVGERGGRLWAVDEGSNTAHPLQANTEHSLQEKYGFTKVSSSSSNNSNANKLKEASDPPNLSTEQRQLLCSLPDLMVRINEGKHLQHLVPSVSTDGTVGWAGVGYVDDGSVTFAHLNVNNANNNKSSKSSKGKNVANNNKNQKDSSSSEMNNNINSGLLSICATAAAQ